MEMNLLSIVQEYLKSIEVKKDVDKILEFYHPQIEQIEYPNLIVKNKTIRNLEEIKQAYERGKQLLQKETYKIKNSYSDENTIIIEAEWIGVLNITVGNKKQGDMIKANFAQIYEFDQGRIIRQRNYDCFEPF